MISGHNFSTFNLESFIALPPRAAKELLEKQENEVDCFIKQIPDLKTVQQCKEESLQLGCRIIAHLYSSDHIKRLSEAMAKEGVWPHSFWERVGADQIAIVNTIKNIVASTLPRDRNKEKILMDSFSTAIKNRNMPAAIEFLKHIPKIPSELGSTFDYGSALGAAVAHLPDPHFLKLVFHKEKWDLQRIKDLVFGRNAQNCKIAVIAYALFKSDTELLTFALAPENNTFSRYENTRLLHNACSIGNRKIVKVLLDLGFKANQVDENYREPIFFVQDTQIIDLLLNAGATIRSTPLLISHTCKCEDSLISHLLDRGAESYFPIFTAYLSRRTVNSDLAKRLVPDKNECIQNCVLHPKTLPFILEKYPDIEPQLKQQVIPLLEITSSQDAYKKILETIKLMNWGHDKFKALIEKNKRDFLDYACKESDTELFKWLIEFGARPSYRGLLAAKKESSQELIELYVEYINKPDEKGDTFIHKLIAARGSVEDLKQLIAMGADLEAKNVSGTALVNACVLGDAETREVLVNAGANIQEAFEVLNYLHENLYEFLDFLLLLSNHPNYQRQIIAAFKEVKNSDLLHQACGKGNHKLIEIFIAEGFDVNQGIRLGLTPIFFARDRKTIDLLLKAGANINQLAYETLHISTPYICTPYTSTPLKRAIRLDNPMVAYLLECGAKATFDNFYAYITRPGIKDPLAIAQFISRREIFSLYYLDRLLAYPKTLAAILKKYPDLESPFKRNFLQKYALTDNYALILLMGWGDQHLVDFLYKHKQNSFIEACKEANVELAKQLREFGMPQSYESLRAAIKSGSLELMELHPEYDINTPDEEEDTILHRIIKSKDSTSKDIKELIALGADMEAKNAQGTALVNACIYKNASAIDVLLSEGADIAPALQAPILIEMQEALPKLLDIALARAELKGKVIAVIREIPHGSLNRNLFKYAIRLGLTDVIGKCIQQGIDVLAEDEDGQTALDEMLGSGIDTNHDT